MIHNHWTLEMKSPKAGEKSVSGQIVEDKFEALWRKRDTKPASVSLGVTEGMDYGALKVTATVFVNCDQNEEAINKAGEAAFYKALELVRDGWSELNKGA